MKRRMVLALLVLCALTLAGCGGVEATYKQAQELMAGGKYAEAGEKFNSIGSYEDASSLAMYCKAAALGESGNHQAAIQAFESFGDYKDSKYMIKYYTAKACEADNDPISAIYAYKEIPLFRDSQAQVDALIANIYNNGLSHAEKGEFDKAYEILELLQEAGIVYRDSEDLRFYCALRYMETGLLPHDYQQYIYVAMLYDILGTYSDSAARAESLRKTVYDAAGEALANQEYDAAIERFSALEGYSDARTQVQMSHYQKAEALLAAKDYDGASEAFAHAGTYSDAQSRIREPYYVQAQDMMAEGKYVDAYIVFSTITGYKDADTLLKTDVNLLAAERKEVRAQYSVGKELRYGMHNGKVLTWQVLAEDGDKVLMVTKNAVATKAYHEGEESTTWGECTLRSWLNDSFLNSAFTPEEQKNIVLMDLKAEGIPSDSQNVAVGKAFLLSGREVYEYFNTGEERICRDGNGETVDWWLRSTGYEASDLSDIVLVDGSIFPVSCSRLLATPTFAPLLHTICA